MIYQYFNVPGIMKLTQEILLLNGPKKRGADNVINKIEQSGKELSQTETQLKMELAKYSEIDWDLKFGNIWRAYEKVLRVSSSQFIYELGQVDKDETELEVKFKYKEIVNNEINEVELPGKITHVFRVYRGSKISFSSGFAFTYFGKDQSNYIKRQLPFNQNPTQDSSIILSEKANSFTPLFTNMVHVQWRSGNDIAWGGTFGLGIPLAGSKDVQYLMGLSIFWGSNERFTFTAGAAGGKVNKLGQGYEMGDKIPSSLDIPITKDQYKIGFFVSISLNLVSQSK